MQIEAPFRAWKLYFVEKQYHPQEELVTVVVRITTFLRLHSLLVRQVVNTHLCSATLRFSSIQDCLGEGGGFQRMMDGRPEDALACLGIAVCEVFYEQEPVGTPVVKIHVRLLGYPPVLPFKDLKAFQIGKFITVQGNIIRVSAIRPQPTRMAFQCAKCQQHIVLNLADGIYQTPAKCTTHHCNSKVFTPNRDSPDTVCVNCQKIKLQEVLEVENIQDEGRIPRILEAELTNDLVDSVVPGEMVLCSGLLKTLDAHDKIGQASSSSSIYLEVLSVQKMRNPEATLGAHPTSNGVEAFAGSLQEIMNIAQGKHTMQTLVRSFCPRIYGNELVKLGLLLGLFGGSRRANSPGQIGSRSGTLLIRSDPHVLIVGDPGLGKSQLLSFAAALAPRAVYVCANTSTAAGLTATVQDGALEAGALVLADQGCCCIDEFDKIGGDGWRSLLDVMEQQTVNVAKAGVVCTLPARASILAAANPVGGHYNKSKNIVENLKMDAALLSRFDLIFVLLDKPNADLDRVLSEHVLGNLKTPRGKASSVEALLSQVPEAPENLRDKLDPRLEVPKVAESLLRQYIAYARQRITPRMTEEAAVLLQEFYLELRRNRVSDETLPITTRHLESMIRLVEARAKMELRHFVTVQDACDVIELIKFCTADTLLPATGPAEKQRRGAGGIGSKSGSVRRYVSELIKISARTSECTFTIPQLQTLYETLSVSEVPFRELLDVLNEHGYLLRRGAGYQLLVT